MSTTGISNAPVTKTVSFQYFTDMWPTGPYREAAGNLRNDYYDFINSID
jgi:hypothetical protein